ncbi:hypothetical protein FTE28_16445 [Bacillus licheniformis]|nr:hypothetical protein AB684_21615 [Bacillus licheniformis]APJ29146.1 hypothetical protein BSZ43_21390 [Bacillus sp. H15-1]ASV17613.1 hypothetical protein CJO35_21575 [Bacillus sp. 1s-1]EQM25476.1 hypothetical protein N399_23545 [Bacillus licheniformis CG-B52]KUL06173.1 hypothetical protein LI17339_21785 [Bacillus licheniformis LMG 17339]MBY8348655.1 hypothetical protein [Bacillus sp. PCH94]NBB44095.1 hypothetical protein [Bacillus sp. y1(2019)]
MFHLLYNEHPCVVVNVKPATIIRMITIKDKLTKLAFQSYKLDENSFFIETEKKHKEVRQD